MMKKMIAGVMAAAMLIGSVPAMAGAQEQGNVMAFEDCGVTLTLPEDFNDLYGTFVTNDDGEPFSGAGVSSFNCSYLAMSQDRMNELMAKEETGEVTEEEGLDYMNRYLPIGAVLTVDENVEVSEADVREYFGGEEGDGSLCAQIGSQNGYNYYLFACPLTEESISEALEPEYTSEYEYVVNAFLESVQNADFYAPAGGEDAMVGYTFDFETNDLDGNPISSEEIFGAHEYTMLNIWSTGCGPCKGELGELAEINDRVADLDCAVVGILADGDSDEAVEEARGLFAENGVTYLNIKAFDSLFDDLVIVGFPTSIFVDRNGTIVRDPIIGAAVDEYEDAFQSLLGA